MINIAAINVLLIDIQNEDIVFSSACLDHWVLSFIGKESGWKLLSDAEKYEKIPDFCKQRLYKEEDFQKWFPNFKYKKYVSPHILNKKVVSEQKIQKIAFELQTHIPLEFSKLCELLTKMYWIRQTEDWNIKTLASMIQPYDNDLYLKIIIDLKYQQNKAA